jgi:hypothetical protein
MGYAQFVATPATTEVCALTGIGNSDTKQLTITSINSSFFNYLSLPLLVALESQPLIALCSKQYMGIAQSTIYYMPCESGMTASF